MTQQTINIDNVIQGTNFPNTTSASIENSFFPSAKIRLIVRFEEYGSTGLALSAPRKPPTVRRGVSANPALQVTKDPSSPAGVTRYLVSSSSGASSGPGGPQVQSSSSDGLTFPIYGIIPQKASWSQNGIRAASTLKATIKYIDAPFDPRLIRSAAIEFYLGSVTGADYAAGLGGSTRSVNSETNIVESLNVVPDSFLDMKGKPRTNLRFQGFVTDWKIRWREDSDPLVEIDCRDNTQLLLDEEVPPALVISATLPIDQAIANYLANFPTFNGISVQYVGEGSPPVLQAVLAGTAYQPTLGPAPAKGGGSTNKLSVWDYITDVTGSISHIAYMDGTTVIITQARTLFSSSRTARADDPYQGRTVDGVDRPYRLFLWGRNLREMSIDRNFSKHIPTGIEVRSYSPRRKMDYVVRFPDPLTNPQQVPVKARPGDNTTDQKWAVWKVRGIEDKPTLLLIAQNLYESIGRNELQVTLETRNLASFGGDNITDPDVLDMKVGDAFDLQVAREDPNSALPSNTIGETEFAIFAAQSAFLTKLGFSQDISNAYAKAYTNAGFQTLFRLRQMAVDWDEDDGVSLHIHGINYVEIRSSQPTDNI